ncbi:MAG: hypothetical protein KDA86_27175 [Planctomycetaceae bacterium]|nr:hypothetical protein [Planctomycetaceae bacterium]
MYLADQALVGHPLHEEILDGYRSQFRCLLIGHSATGAPSEIALLAATLITQPEIPDLVERARIENLDQVVDRLNCLEEKKRLTTEERQEFEQLQSEEEFLGKLVPQEWVSLLIEGTTGQPAYRQCPPSGWRHPYDPERDPCVFWMGSPEGVGDDSEHPRHQVCVKPFEMQTTVVTKEQYSLFDPANEIVHKEGYSHLFDHMSLRQNL